MLTAVGIIALVHLLSVLALFLGGCVLVLIGYTVLTAARSVRDWLKPRLLAEKPLASGVMTLDQLVQLPKEDELDG